MPNNCNVKKCSTCKKIKPIHLFSKDKTVYGGKCRRCKNCIRISYLKHREKRLAAWHKWRKENPDRIKKQKKIFYQRHKKEIRAWAKKNYWINREKILSKNMLWRKHSLKGQFMDIMRGAFKRGIPFKITFEYAVMFKNKRCFYCGDPINRIGLDRYDNSKGYIKGNIVACCTTCNRMKLDHSCSFFITQCNKIINWRNKTNESPVVLT